MAELVITPAALRAVADHCESWRAAQPQEAVRGWLPLGMAVVLGLVVECRLGGLPAEPVSAELRGPRYTGQDQQHYELWLDRWAGAMSRACRASGMPPEYVPKATHGALRVAEGLRAMASHLEILDPPEMVATAAAELVSPEAMQAGCQARERV